MKAHLAATAAMAAALLTGCGTATTDAADDPAPATSPHRAPHWPAEGCDIRSGSSIDYTPDARGADSPALALARYTPPGTSVVKQKARPHRAARWLVVDEDRVIVRAVTMFRGDHGWLVDGVEECSG